jgi:hypothetical protein
MPGSGTAPTIRTATASISASSLYLLLLAALSPDEKAQLLTAALAHDFHHHGRSVCGTHFRLEYVAVGAAMPYLEAAGISETARACIAALILASEVSIAVPFGRQCYRHFSEGGARPAVPGDEPQLSI